MSALLTVENLNVSYGAIKAVQDVNFVVNNNEIVSLIGANGAGKTTILRTISGLEKPTKGRILFENQNILTMNSERIVSSGVAQVPEGRRVFSGMTVQENLQLGTFTRGKGINLKDEYTLIYDQFPILKERRNQDAATLSGGEQQMLAMGRALMAKPKLLLLDEPSMGLAPLFIEKVFDIIKNVNAQGMTVLIIEQNANQALKIADRGYVLESGKITMTGTGAELLASDDVRKAYLGG
ncbi:ABC transporter ATP-binding protein [Leuconostoc mesenteroides]|uniref:Amino acid/amide ABC transporter ATP-binding protein 2, HAAT family n=1 Tax=Leuconostoc mesenteroides subsp. mesenteroides (strain ATCC 8293 / DSM 20343 / BCRC 11652 / CCM 1803 / JCM 6124 / NCDO 523 / NBRC 100496 / NCIMB 8023 / NCTC 12954 / NRRL B-1118 / 37Y) TaxID=203120 RepID=Q03YX2_LEUMM|nr:ABC transporter ATP-binding protein [Leuconostoc mesenteroides]ABJ61600.1 amino acid/amide ABC transporter ATP-binding protein 2, HAAT family [Leuconostoc mesenteroides subsp. mesenteroides ATCC 8293]MCT3042039.1 ABC transporter ATP-binding protein [Leuconostoc mesenteroides]MCU4665384.1 ABC transporter ATP-binding protein [Leuconostoc mesenteroides]MDG9745842.1 ABC transporter ATP-binding protein [Leuconostoc mesenteroides]QQB31571.1 ABC transporter ATP-binding protein [Leuconostoc mesente